MKRTFAVLMTAALLLTGCGGNAGLDRELAEARERWAASEGLGFTADVNAELEDSVFRCSLAVTRREEETVVEVLEPEEIAGIRARLREGESEIEYDGLILAVGDAAGGGISPLSAMPMLTDALLTGHAGRLWIEKEGERELVAAQVYITDEEYAVLWLDRENFAPRHMELVSGGRAVVKCEVTDYTED